MISLNGEFSLLISTCSWNRLFLKKNVFSITQKLTHLTADTLFPALLAHISYYILDTLALPLLQAFMRSRLTGRL